MHTVQYSTVAVSSSLFSLGRGRVWDRTERQRATSNNGKKERGRRNSRHVASVGKRKGGDPISPISMEKTFVLASSSTPTTVECHHYVQYHQPARTNSTFRAFISSSLPHSLMPLFAVGIFSPLPASFSPHTVCVQLFFKKCHLSLFLSFPSY